MDVLDYVKKQYNNAVKNDNCDHVRNECKCYCHTELGFMHMIACCRVVKCEQCDKIYNKVKQQNNK